jgi:hypothetical protein
MSILRSARKKYLDFNFWLHQAKLARKHGHFSNFGEQEIIEKYITQFQIAEQSKSIIDIGAGDGVRKSNTFSLFMKGWSGVGIEYDNRKAAGMANAYQFYPEAFACRCQVTPFNIVNLFEAYSIDPNFGILSLDIDGYDYWVLEAILASYRPRLIVSEYNEKIPPPVKFVVDYDPDFKMRHHFFGYSLAKLKDLLVKYKYVLLEIEYNNVFLAPAELDGAKSVDVEQAYREGYLERSDRKEKFKENENMEVLHKMSPEECIEFLNKFYAEHKKYQIGLD